MSAGYVLDAFALLAYFRDEPGAAMVQRLLEEARAGRQMLHLSLVNYGEILYISERLGGPAAARDVIRMVDALPIKVVAPDRALTFLAAHLKAQYAISLADAFAAALAVVLGFPLVTGDPELQKVREIQVEWLAQENRSAKARPARARKRQSAAEP